MEKNIIDTSLINQMAKLVNSYEIARYLESFYYEQMLEFLGDDYPNFDDVTYEMGYICFCMGFVGGINNFNKMILHFNFRGTKN